MTVEALLGLLVEREGSDLHLTPDAPAFLRKDGELVPAGWLPAMSLGAWLGGQAGLLRRLQQAKEGVDCALSFAGRRLRGHAYLAGGREALAFRLLPERIPTLEEIGAPEGLAKLPKARHGLILLCGRTGSGKSTTLAALLLAMARRRHLHCISLEDPVEFLYHEDGSIFHQRELGRDFTAFDAAVRSALREDPDVLLISELRDCETIRAALAAAEAGTLVLSTIHARTAAEAPQRLADFFPAEEQGSVRAAFAASLTAIASERLVRVPHGRRAVYELLLRTPAICHMIRTADDQQIASAMLSGARLGMTTFSQEGQRLLQSGVLTQQSVQELMGE